MRCMPLLRPHPASPLGNSYRYARSMARERSTSVRSGSRCAVRYRGGYNQHHKYNDAHGGNHASATYSTPGCGLPGSLSAGCRRRFGERRWRYTPGESHGGHAAFHAPGYPDVAVNSCNGPRTVFMPVGIGVLAVRLLYKINRAVI